MGYGYIDPTCTYRIPEPPSAAPRRVVSHWDCPYRKCGGTALSSSSRCCLRSRNSSTCAKLVSSGFRPVMRACEGHPVHVRPGTDPILQPPHMDGTDMEQTYTSSDAKICSTEARHIHPLPNKHDKRFHGTGDKCHTQLLPQQMHRLLLHSAHQQKHVYDKRM